VHFQLKVLPLGIPVWYLSDKKQQYGFTRNEEAPPWRTVPYRPTYSTGSEEETNATEFLNATNVQRRATPTP